MKPNENNLSLFLLKSLLLYNANTGTFTWLKTASSSAVKGQIAGSLDEGYVRIRINKNSYRAHRLAWFYTYGEWPKNQIDHINGNKSDNRLSNLRDVTNTENSRNKQIHRNGKLLGVSYSAVRKKWIARLTLGSTRHFLGYFDTEQAAYEACCKAKQKHSNSTNNLLTEGPKTS